MNIATILQERAATHPEIPAIIDTHRGRSRTTTFAGLETAAGRAATLLRQNGLQPGDSALIFHPMSAELYIALAALFRLGVVAMFLDPGAGADHIERCCALYPPKALIASTKAHLLRLKSPALRQIPVKIAIGCPVPGAISWRSAQQMKPGTHIIPRTPDTPALLTFTSGSTGQPKAALRTHGFLLAQHRILAETLQLKPAEIDLATLPIFLLANLASGLTSLIPNADLRFPGAIRAGAAIAQIQAIQPVRAAASPAFLERLAEYCLTRRLTLPSLQKIFCGGAPVMPNLLAQLQQIAPNAEITVVYGSTEAEPIAHISHSQIGSRDTTATLSGKGLLVGHPVSAIKIAILRQQWGTPIGPLTGSEFAENCLSAGAVGEIAVSGEHVLPGYLYGYGDRETKFTADGTPWHRTGDAGYLDSDNRLWLMGRCSARIEDSWGTLYPFAVECVAHHYPGIRRCAAISHKGQRILAVELNRHKTHVSLAALQNTLNWAHISAIKVLPKIPTDKRHNAKIEYPPLRKLLARH
ncbi:MAG: AMP-binding protein [Oscillatoria princeps RMCB-10]|jgi:acyl-CoA synthetase (AMP-forming)/AMP-acid ligase II|nr:AMP-binding protein [Oscillatoria princeps RMCB-10]